MAIDVTRQRYRVAGGNHVVADVGGDPCHPAVVLLHGGGQTRHSWGKAMQELLQAGYHVVNLEARGHGDSDWAHDRDYTLPRLAEDLLTVIQTLQSVPALVGASLGGITALYAVGNSTAALARCLVVVDVVPRIEASGGDRIAAFMSANPGGFLSLEAAADAVAAYYPERLRPKDPSGLMKNLRRINDRLFWHWDPEFIRGPLQLEPPRVVDALLDASSRVRIPTLLVRGLRSDVVSDAGVEEFRRVLPGLEVLDVAGAGHMVAGDRNDAFNEGVIGFLQRHLPPP